MHGLEHAARKAQTRYDAVWRDTLLGAEPGPYSMPLDPPTAAEIAAQPAEISAWLNSWRQWAANHPRVTLRTRTIRTRHGPQHVYTHLDIPCTAALAGLTPATAAHWRQARSRWVQMRPVQPGPAVRPWLKRIVELDDYDFTTLLAAVAWFRAHPRSGLTVRGVPVPGMHTKWLARHRSMVIACLGIPASPGQETDPDPADIPTGDLDALGLRALPPEIGVVLADPALRAAAGGLRQISAPADELASLSIRPAAVLIIENKEPALAWPDTPGLAIIHSLGNHLDVLNQLPWIGRASCWYWGDLDRHGLTLLSRARAVIPPLPSLLMTAADVATYRPVAVEEDVARWDEPAPTLGPSEAAALEALRIRSGRYLRTEQERIPIRDAENALALARNLAPPKAGRGARRHLSRP
jgi:hypothetical protein